MPPDEIVPGSSADWLRHARSDLAYARAPLPPDALWEGLCFHAQQAAEKSIKAVLVAHRLEVPRTHNLKTLLEHLPPTVSIPTAVEAAVVLTDYLCCIGIPGIWKPLTRLSICGL
jgi:HEPN domain-containing protein